MKRLLWVLVGVGISLACYVLVNAQWTTDRYMRDDRSISNAKSVVGGCLHYRRLPRSGGKYPASLDELIRAEPNEIPMAEAGTLLDGWGNRFHYAVVVNENGQPEPYVWAERVVDGKTYLCGAKGMDNGEVVMFGLPE